MTTQRYLVTGATGLIGRHLTPLILRRGGAVDAIVRRPPEAIGESLRAALDDAARGLEAERGGTRPSVWIAGGLNPENAAAAATLGADGLDVSSGVEREPGMKDEAKLRAFFSALRGRGRRAASEGGAR